MKKRNAVIAAAVAGIMVFAGCSSNNSSSGTSASDTSATPASSAEVTTAESTAQEDTTPDTEEITSDDASEEPEEETDEDITEDDDDSIENDTDDNITDETEQENGGASSETVFDQAPFGETVIREGEEISFTETINAMKDVTSGSTYTFGMNYGMTYGDQEMKMSILIAQHPELGIYSDTDMLFMSTKMIKRPDGSLIIIDDANKNYVLTTEDESGTMISNDTSQAFVFVKEDVTTADLVQFPDDPKNYYRFFISADNMAGSDESESSSGDVYMYFDAETLYLTNMYMVAQGSEVKAYITISAEVDSSLYEIPADYTEISFEEYQKQMLSSLGSSFGVESAAE